MFFSVEFRVVCVFRGYSKRNHTQKPPNTASPMDTQRKTKAKKTRTPRRRNPVSAGTPAKVCAIWMNPQCSVSQRHSPHCAVCGMLRRGGIHAFTKNMLPCVHRCGSFQRCLVPPVRRAACNGREKTEERITLFF